MPAEQLKSYEEELAQYHLHPEVKFHNGDYMDRSITSRRHVVVVAVEHIGKKANRWEEQFHLGLDIDAQTEYGIGPKDTERALDYLRAACEQVGQRAVAKAVRMSLRDVSAIVHGKRVLIPAMVIKLCRAIPGLRAASPRAG